MPATVHIALDDRRLCLTYRLRPVYVAGLDTLMVGIELFASVGDQEPVAMHACGADEARTLGVELLQLSSKVRQRLAQGQITTGEEF